LAEQKEQLSVDEMKHFIGGLMLDRYVSERQLMATIQQKEKLLKEEKRNSK